MIHAKKSSLQRRINMNKLLIILSSVSSSITSTSETETGTHKVYPLNEAIFYYCLFAAVVVLFIIYILKRGSDSKIFSNLVNKLGRDCDHYLDVIMKVQNGADIANFKLKKRMGKTLLTLAQFDTIFVQYKEKTRLDNFDKLLSEKQHLYSKIKKFEKDDINLKELIAVQGDLAHFKGQIDLVRGLVK